MSDPTLLGPQALADTRFAKPDVAAYVERMARELEPLAAGAGHVFLASLLRMVVLEASTVRADVPATRIRADRPAPPRHGVA